MSMFPLDPNSPPVTSAFSCQELLNVHSPFTGMGSPSWKPDVSVGKGAGSSAIPFTLWIMKRGCVMLLRPDPHPHPRGSRSHSVLSLGLPMCWSLSRVWFFVTSWTVAQQAPLSVEFSRQEYWTGLPLPSPSGMQLWASLVQSPAGVRPGVPSQAYPTPLHYLPAHLGHHNPISTWVGFTLYIYFKFQGFAMPDDFCLIDSSVPPPSVDNPLPFHHRAFGKNFPNLSPFASFTCNCVSFNRPQLKWHLPGESGPQDYWTWYWRIPGTCLVCKDVGAFLDDDALVLCILNTESLWGTVFLIHYCMLITCLCVCVFVWVHICVLSHVWLLESPWTVAHQALLSMEVFRQEYWVGYHFFLQGIFLTQWLNQHLFHLLHWQADTLPCHHLGSLCRCLV